jgi:hypothetical protein
MLIDSTVLLAHYQINVKSHEIIVIVIVIVVIILIWTYKSIHVLILVPGNRPARGGDPLITGQSSHTERGEV